MGPGYRGEKKGQLQPSSPRGSPAPQACSLQCAPISGRRPKGWLPLGLAAPVVPASQGYPRIREEGGRSVPQDTCHCLSGGPVLSHGETARNQKLGKAHSPYLCFNRFFRVREFTAHSMHRALYFCTRPVEIQFSSCSLTDVYHCYLVFSPQSVYTTLLPCVLISLTLSRWGGNRYCEKKEESRPLSYIIYFCYS